jgi:hypothetical protein
VLFQKRSILTERLSRRGYHLSREYGVDPLETVMVSEVMRKSGSAARQPATKLSPEIAFAYPDETLRVVAERMAKAHVTDMRVLDAASGKETGSISLEDMLHARVRSYTRETNHMRVRRLRLPFMKARMKKIEDLEASVK